MKFSHRVLSVGAILFGVSGVVSVNAQISVRPPAGVQADLKAVLPVIDCAELTSLRGVSISSIAAVATRITSAKVVKGEPADYCEVKGYVSPQVNFEVHLPTTSWT